MFYSLACNMQPFCSNLTCKWEERLSKNRRAVNCGARERDKGRALSYSEGRMKEGARFMCRENRNISILTNVALS